jgi:hypothetical protein
MDNLSRRSFLKKGSVAVGAAGVAVAAPGLRKVVRGNSPSGEQSGAREPELSADAANAGPLVAHVRNVATGEIDLFVGERRVTVKDRATASRLYRATR